MTAPNNPVEQESVRKERRSKPARCPKCGVENPPGRNTCESCGSHLYVSCRDCGERNLRSHNRCSACGRRLHRPLLQKIFNRKLGRTTKVTALQLVFLAIAVAIGYKAIVFFVERLSTTRDGGESAMLHLDWRA